MAETSFITETKEVIARKSCTSQGVVVSPILANLFMHYTEFDFLSYTFKGIFIKDILGRLQFNFLASVSRKSAKTFRDKLKALSIHQRTGCKINMLAELLSPRLGDGLTTLEDLNFFCRQIHHGLGQPQID
jgi:hypothetical protein